MLFYVSKLTYLMSLVSYFTPWKQKKTSDFFMFSGGIERNQGYEMG